MLFCEATNDYIFKLYTVQTRYLSKFFKFDAILLFSTFDNKIIKITKEGIEVPIEEYTHSSEKLRLEFPVQYIFKKKDLFSLVNDSQFYNERLACEEIYTVDLIFMEQFLKVLDDDLFNININKFYRFEDERENHISLIHNSFVHNEPKNSFYSELQAYYIPTETL